MVKQIYAGRVFTVQVESFTLPDGREVTTDVIRHPPSVIIIPQTAEGDILLVRQYRHPIGRSAWELPAGSLEPGEDVEQAAIRECHEEVGLVPSHIEKLGSFFPTPGYCDEEMHFYRASGLRKPGADESAKQDEDEDIEARAFSLDDIRRMIADGEIIDLKTLAGLYWMGG